MRRSTLPALLLLPLLICGCDSWPPKEDQAVKHFVENRESFEALETKLNQSKYFDVSTRGPDSVEGSYDLLGEPTREFVDKDMEWSGLFRAAGMWRITKDDGYFVFAPSIPLSVDVRIVEISYEHYVSGKSDLKACKAEYEELMCGVCRVEIDTDWQIKYMWYPFPETDDERERLFGETVSDDQFGERISSYLEQCRLGGLTAIGYEIE